MMTSPTTLQTSALFSLILVTIALGAMGCAEQEPPPASNQEPVLSAAPEPVQPIERFVVPGFWDYLTDYDGVVKPSPLCTWVNASDAVVLARVVELGFSTSPIVVLGEEVECDALLTPSVEVDFETVEVFSGELGPRFHLSLGGDLELIPPIVTLPSGEFEWDDDFEEWMVEKGYGALKPGQLVGMFLRRLDDEGKRWALTYLGWFGMKSDGRMHQYPIEAVQWVIEDSFDGITNTTFRERVVACSESLSAEERSRIHAQNELKRQTILATRRGIAAYCYVPKGTIVCEDAACAGWTEDE